ncbi:MAG: nitroreductase family protein [Advenella sp.]
MAVTTTEQERDLLYSLISHRRSVRQFTDAPIDEHALMRILTCAQGINSSDGKRGAPSAHALYPLALTVLLRRVQGVEAGSYSFDPQRNRLDRLAHAPVSGSLLPVSLADDVWLETAPVVIVISADYDLAMHHFANQQSDGLRGARYVDVETGAVAQNLYLAAQMENLGGVLVMGIDDEALARQLTLPAAHKPVALFCLGQGQVS